MYLFTDLIILIPLIDLLNALSTSSFQIHPDEDHVFLVAEVCVLFINFLSGLWARHDPHWIDLFLYQKKTNIFDLLDLKYDKRKSHIHMYILHYALFRCNKLNIRLMILTFIINLSHRLYRHYTKLNITINGISSTEWENSIYFLRQKVTDKNSAI